MFTEFLLRIYMGSHTQELPLLLLINKCHGLVKGQQVSSRETFTSMNRKEFSPDNFRRYLENPQQHKAKDYEDYSKTINEEFFDHKANVIQTADLKSVNTICSKTGTNFFSARMTSKKTVPKGNRTLAYSRSSTTLFIFNFEVFVLSLRRELDRC